MSILLAVLVLAFSTRSQYVLPTTGVRNFGVHSAGTSTVAPGSDDATSIVFSYDRVPTSVLVYHGALADFSRLQFEVAAETHDGSLILGITDIDGARWNFPVSFNSGMNWISADVSPADFVLAVDSPVWKAKFDPARLRSAYLTLVDANVILIGTGSNVLHFRNIQVLFSAFGREETAVTITTGQDVVWEDTSVSVAGPLTIANGRLHLRNVSRFFLTEDITVTNGGELYIEDSFFVIPQLFNHQRQFTFTSSNFTLVNTTLAMFFPLDLKTNFGSTFVGTGVLHSSGGWSLGLGTPVGQPDSCLLQRYEHVGEIIIGAGSVIDIDDCSDAMLWHAFTEPVIPTIVFPDEVTPYVSDPSLPYSVSVKDSTGTAYGIIAAAACDVTIDSSTVRAVALYFVDGTVQLDNIVNGLTYTDSTFAFGTLSVRFTNTLVTTFNFYTSQTLPDTDVTELTVVDCLFGEIFTFGYSKTIIRESECDGTGGYLNTRDDSEIEAYDSTINSKAIAADDSTMTLTDCVVNGDVVANDNGIVYLYRTTVNGELLETGGTIIVDNTPIAAGVGTKLVSLTVLLAAFLGVAM